MPRYPMTTYLSEQEIAIVNQTCKNEGLMKADQKGTMKPNYYAFMKKAALAFCEACKKEKKQDDRKGEPEGKPTGESPEGIAHDKREVDGANKSLPEAADYTAAANHADPEDIGF